MTTLPPAVVVGESVLDLIEEGDAASGVFRASVGGGPLNVAVGLQRLGTSAHLISAVGLDEAGTRVRQLLDAEGVTVLSSAGPGHRTVVALATRRAGPLRFHPYGELSSGWEVSGPALAEAVRGARVLVTGYSLLTFDAGVELIGGLLDVPGPLKVLDPNVRPAAVADPIAYREILSRLLRDVDVVKMSDEDVDSVYGWTVDEAVKRLHTLGPSTVLLTLGARGAVISTAGRVTSVPAHPVTTVVDTTGAGDAWLATITHHLATAPDPLQHDALVQAAGHAARNAAAVCTAYGALAGMPHTREQPV